MKTRCALCGTEIIKPVFYDADDWPGSVYVCFKCQEVIK